MFVSQILNEVVRPSHGNRVSHLVSNYMLGYFLSEDLLVGVVRTKHLDDLDFLRRVFASLVHTLLMDGSYIIINNNGDT
jgi:hypothetical protein